MSRKIIFVSGVHGVGKTTLCKQLSKELNIEAFTSSELIKQLDQSKVNADKHVDNININEDILIQAINKYIDSDSISILDGHFCLIDKVHKLKYIPSDIFAQINPSGFIVLIDEPINIQKKLEHRDNRTEDINFINEAENDEVSYAKNIANQLKKPLLICDKKTTLNEILTYIKKVISL